MKRPGVNKISNVAYGDAPRRRNLLDIYQPAESREGGYPVLLQVHGGAWMIGEKEHQALPLMYHLAQRGWICVAINYRLCPSATFPDPIVDVKKAIAWIREHIAEYGGNSEFLAITGGSAGGHLSSLAALTANKPEFQPGFEAIDTSIDAAVPFYGVYDFLDRHNILGSMSLEGLGKKHLFKCAPDENPELWDAMSSESNVSAAAPPFFVIQGTHDSLVWEETASYFVDALRRASENPVAYAQVVGAQHAFDIFHCLRADNAVNAATDFLEWAYANKKAAN
jgi:acetyl esterase/lipase